MYITSKTLSSAAASRRIAHGFFGRKGGVSEGLYASLNCGAGSKDAPQSVAENKRRVREALGAHQLVTLSQVHSADVMIIAERDALSGQSADALVTNQSGIALGILTADCGPVLFADSEAGVIGAAHAGWKGAAGGVLEHTVSAMESLGAQRGRIVAALGPTIAQASYEVGAEFKAGLLAKDAANERFFNEALHFNLPAYICARLAQMGLASAEDLAIDTYSNEQDYFSYRRTTHQSEPDYGRQISCIMLKEPRA